MGNRAIVVFKGKFNNEGVQPAIYLHWGGSQVRSLLLKTNQVMIGRDNDAQYSAARFCQTAAAEVGGNLSIGLTTVNLDSPGDSSHGDAGVFVVDVSKRVWQVENHDGSECEGAFSGPVDCSNPDAKPDAEKDWHI